MSSVLKKSLLPLIFSCIFNNVLPLSADESTLVQDCNDFFLEIDKSFLRIVDAGALRSNNLNQAERFFIREMRKNRAFFTFLRTNSKGIVISEVIRGEKVERPMRDVQYERWFKFTNEKMEPYYTLKKEEDRGRYYLYWARPILKQGDRFVGTVLLKIDLWDSFYEFSNSIYMPFLVKLGNTSFFSHKWKNSTNGTEELLGVPGIGKISITFNTVQKSTPDTSVTPMDTVKQAVVSAADTQKTSLEQNPVKKEIPGILIVSISAIVIGIMIASGLLISWMRKRALIRKIDEDDLL